MKAGSIAFWALALAIVIGCEGPRGPAGTEGPEGAEGPEGPAGPAGPQGDAGVPGRNAYLTGPGVKLEITGAQIDSGTLTVSFRITDDAGTPLDRAGLYTEGPVSISFIVARLGVDAQGRPTQYTAYTTRDVTSPITGNTATQAGTDSGGTFAEVGVGQGTYTYRFGTTLSVQDPDNTHTVGAYATRTFEGVRYVANATYNFVPSGAPVTVTREVVRTSACNNCHNPLALHGGSRREVGLCVLCHSPQTTDPDTGNTVDLKVMVHKIHRGANLPSVVAGTPYQIIGHQQSVHDYSTVKFPQDLRRCETCHQGAQADLRMTRPSREACGACHDLTSFVGPVPPGYTLHTGGTQADDSQCVTCHPPQGGLAGITDKHLFPGIDPASTQVSLAILDVTSAGPSQTPTVTFQVQVNGAPRDILAMPLTRLALTVAGPTTDYASYWSVTIQGSGATGTPIPVDASSGIFQYTSPSPMPADAAGSYAFALEGYLQATGGPRYAAMNPVHYVAVTDTTATPRRQVVALANCNKCHFDLSGHGGSRRTPEYCVMCHNPNNTGDERVARREGTTVTARSVHFKVMIHKIHSGEHLVQQPYILGGYPAPTVANPDGTPLNFGEVRFPGNRADCKTCHLDGTYSVLLPPTALPTREEDLTCTEDPAADGDDYCSTRVVSDYRLMPPASAACTACHDAPYVEAHAAVMTAPSGVESCGTCHGPGSDYDVMKVHQPAP